MDERTTGPLDFYTNSIWLKSNTDSDQIVLAYNTGNRVGIEWTVTPQWKRFILSESSYNTSNYRESENQNFLFGTRGGGSDYSSSTNVPQTLDILA